MKMIHTIKVNSKLILSIFHKKSRDLNWGGKMIPFYNYIPMMIDHLQKHKPKRILEWGTGLSTEMLSVFCPESEIISYENKLSFYLFNKFKLIPFPNIKLYYVPNLKKYYRRPLKLGQFDFIFIDGRERANCLKIAKKIVKDDGFVMVHDYNREKYKKGIDLFKIVKKEEITILLKK